MSTGHEHIMQVAEELHGTYCTKQRCEEGNPDPYDVEIWGEAVSDAYATLADFGGQEREDVVHAATMLKRQRVR